MNRFAVRSTPFVAAMLATFVVQASGQTVFSGSGAAAATAKSQFQSAIGGANNGGVAGSQATGRRQITWDGVNLTTVGVGGVAIDPGKTIGIATDRFRNVGAIYPEIYAVSGDGFSSVNPDAAGNFPSFSPTRTFAMFNDNKIEQTFVVPGGTTQAAVRGFGAVFVDVELANTSSIEYFQGNNSLGKFFASANDVSGEFAFLGVLFNQPIVTQVVLTLGNKNLFNFDGANFSSAGAENPGSSLNPTDIVVTDDFVFAEPQAVPEPGALALFGIGGLFVVGNLARIRRGTRV